MVQGENGNSETLTTESIRAILRLQEEAYLRLFDRLVAEGRAVDPLFFAAVGKHYTEAHRRILLIGKATAGWHHEGCAATLRSSNYRRQERHSCSDKFLDGGGIPSAFWRLAKNLNEIAPGRARTPNIDIDEASYSLGLIAWSNLFKIAAQGKNPTPSLQSKQHEEALALLRAELTAFRPHLVVFVTEPFGDDLVYEALVMSKGPRDGLSEGTDGQRAFYYRHRMEANSPAILWVQHPEGQPSASVEIWLDKAKELLQLFQ
jgi:hypothetical protein